MELYIDSNFEYKSALSPETGSVDAYVEYTITFQLATNQLDANGERVVFQHEMKNRYRELSNKHKRIADYLKSKSIRVPDFPGKSFARRMMKLDQVKQRNNELQRYYRALLIHRPEVLESYVVRDELEMTLNPEFHNQLREYTNQLYAAGYPKDSRR